MEETCTVNGLYGSGKLFQCPCDYFIRWVDKKPYGGLVFYFWGNGPEYKEITHACVCYAYFDKRELEVHQNPSWADRLYAETFNESHGWNKDGWVSFWEGRKPEEFSVLGKVMHSDFPIYVREDESGFIITYLDDKRYEEYHCKSYGHFKVQNKRKGGKISAAELEGDDGKKHCLSVEEFCDPIVGWIYRIWIK